MLTTNHSKKEPMDRDVRRKLEAALQKHAECCAVCKNPYQHMSKTYGGMTATGQFIVTCEACKKSLSVCYVMGMFVPKGPPTQAHKALFESHPLSSFVIRPGVKI